MSAVANAQTQSYTYELARSFSQSLFENNGVPFMQPVVKVINATSNSRFYNQAYVPKKVSKPYYRISVNGMSGMVNPADKTYEPYMPREEFSFEDIGRYGQLDFANQTFNVTDTAGLIFYFFKNLMYDGIEGAHAGAIQVPREASTALGNKESYFELPTESLEMLAENHPAYQFLPADMRDSLLAVLEQFPDRFTLYAGNNIDAVFAAVPQIEIGSLYGTELLVRFIPPLDYGETIGKFAFWGIGLKHSLSQYFKGRPFDAAIQLVYQGTSLENEIGVTKAELTSNATFLNGSLQFSKEFGEHIVAYTGLSYETVSITSEYVYKLPVEVQWQLGLLEDGKQEPTPGYPGDQNPQKSELTLDDSNLKYKIGVMGRWNNFGLALDYNFSNFDILSFGLEYSF